MDHGLAIEANVELFEQLSRLAINFHKIELCCFGKAKEHELKYTQIYGNGLSPFPFKYLKIPIPSKKLHNRELTKIKKILLRRVLLLVVQEPFLWLSSGLD